MNAFLAAVRLGARSRTVRTTALGFSTSFLAFNCHNWTLAEEEDAIAVSTTQQPRAVYCALYLLEGSRELLSASIPATLPRVFGKFLTLQIHPSHEYLEEASSLMDKVFGVEVLGVAMDSHAQVLVCRLIPRPLRDSDEKEDGAASDSKALTLQSEFSVPHVTLSLAEDTLPFYSNILLQRIKTAAGPSLTSSSSGWHGDLPADGINAATTASFTPLAEPLRLYGIVCTDDRMVLGEDICDVVSHCPLCRMYMSSPCKHAFKAWERCMDISKLEALQPEVVCMGDFEDLLDCGAANRAYFDDYIARHRAPDPEPQPVPDPEASLASSVSEGP